MDKDFKEKVLKLTEPKKESDSIDTSVETLKIIEVNQFLEDSLHENDILDKQIKHWFIYCILALIVFIIILLYKFPVVQEKVLHHEPVTIITPSAVQIVENQGLVYELQAPGNIDFSKVKKTNTLKVVKNLKKNGQFYYKGNAYNRRGIATYIKGNQLVSKKIESAKLISLDSLVDLIGSQNKSYELVDSVKKSNKKRKQSDIYFTTDGKTYYNKKLLKKVSADTAETTQVYTFKVTVYDGSISGDEMVKTIHGVLSSYTYTLKTGSSYQDVMKNLELALKKVSPVFKLEADNYFYSYYDSDDRNEEYKIECKKGNESSVPEKVTIYTVKDVEKWWDLLAIAKLKKWY